MQLMDRDVHVDRRPADSASTTAATVDFSSRKKIGRLTCKQLRKHLLDKGIIICWDVSCSSFTDLETLNTILSVIRLGCDWQKSQIGSTPLRRT